MAVNTQLGLLDTGRQEPFVSSPPKKNAEILPLVYDGIKTGVNMLFQDRQNRLDREAQTQAATTAYERQKELMQMEWDYMSPSAQMLRFASAGLNPNLIYSQLNPPGSAPSAPQAEAPNQTAPQMGSIDWDNALLGAQLDNIRADTALKDKSVEKSDAEIKDIFKGLEYKDSLISEIKSHIDFMDENRRMMVDLAAMYRSQTNVYNREAKLKEIDYLFQQATLGDRIDQVSTTLKMDKDRAKYLVQGLLASILKDKATAKYYFEKANTEPYQRILFDAMTASNLASGSLAIAQRDYQKALTEKYPDLSDQQIATMAAEEFNLYSNTVQGIVGSVIEEIFPQSTVERTSERKNSKGGKDVDTGRTRKRKPFWRPIGRGYFR